MVDNPHEIADITTDELQKLVIILKRAKTILGNMAWENEGCWIKRWPISHEPLRADAKNLLPDLETALQIFEPLVS